MEIYRYNEDGQKVHAKHYRITTSAGIVYEIWAFDRVEAMEIADHEGIFEDVHDYNDSTVEVV